MRLTCAIALIFAFSAANAASTWVQQAPNPRPGSWRGVCALSAQRAWVVGDNRQVAETRDGGKTWIQHHSGAPEEASYEAVRFFDANRGVIAGNGQPSLTTGNSGLTWNKVYWPGGIYAEDMDIVGPGTMICMYGGDINKSTDYGNTWTLTLPNVALNNYYMDFRDSSTGLVVGVNINNSDETGVWRTTDGGQTFNRTFVNTDYNNNVVMWLDNTRAITLANQVVMLSVDEGVSWFPYGYFANPGIIDWTQIPGTTTLLAVSGDGNIYRSGDDGQSWSQTYTGLGQGMWPNQWADIHAAPDGSAWAVGTPGFILRSTDGGLTWQQKSSTMGTIPGELKMYDSQFGIMAGHPNYAHVTRDGGKSWEAFKFEIFGQSIYQAETIAGVDIVNSNFAAIGGDGGLMYKTLDGGHTWQNIGHPRFQRSFQINSVEFIDENVGWVSGFDNDVAHITHNLFKTVNGGETWSLVSTAGVPFDRAQGIPKILFVNSSLGFFLGTSPIPRVARTTNGGANWTVLYLPGGDEGESVRSIRARTQTEIWVAGDHYVGRSTDGGATWVERLPIPDPLGYHDIVFPGPNEVWVVATDPVSYDSILFKSFNNGQTWTRERGVSWPYQTKQMQNMGSQVWATASVGGAIYETNPSWFSVRPTAQAITNGSWLSGANAQLQQTDDLYWKLRPGVNPNNGLNAYQAVFTGFSPSAFVEEIEVQVETRPYFGQHSEMVEMFNYKTSGWDRVQYMSANTHDQIWTSRVLADTARYLHPRTGEMKLRVTALEELPDTSGIQDEYWVDEVVWKVKRGKRWTPLR